MRRARLSPKTSFRRWWARRRHGRPARSRSPARVSTWRPAAQSRRRPALYVHGLGGSSLNWTDLADLLADRVDAQAIDLPGFGRSDPARNYTLATLAGA